MELNLNGKTVLVTAASMGIGKAAVETFIKEGCKVVVCSSKQENLLKAVNEIKNQFGVEPIWTVCDLNKPGDIDNTVKVAEDNYGGIDILVNNCGGPKPGYFDELNENDWTDAYNQVLMSAQRFIRLVLPAMKRNNWGRIINVTSLSVKQPVDNLVLSNTFRSGLTALAKTLSLEVGKHNITINNVAPGYTLTARLYDLAVNKAKVLNESHEHILSEMANQVPLKRLGRPDEVASMIVYLASEQAGYITGQTIAVDGGIIKSTY
ncbi:MAG: SDR family oxidoreductase [Melioribacteraceae bacterium]|nr:SDR family oxidoreductase [Melioribacteraceae bacterium]MCF8354240.1 SDR family oxidoreductase [Melioribacteraceae bacterium]MCF8394729.1 SDR family oxidoreductase [Melioribacteraceae bacterium]MCF8417971.1 SDR family oxidoreductase [Melioribacteraceae bacterium]